jgi:hypothetical protein
MYGVRILDHQALICDGRSARPHDLETLAASAADAAEPRPGAGVAARNPLPSACHGREAADLLTPDAAGRASVSRRSEARPGSDAFLGSRCGSTTTGRSRLCTGRLGNRTIDNDSRQRALRPHSRSCGGLHCARHEGGRLHRSIAHFRPGRAPGAAANKARPPAIACACDRGILRLPQSIQSAALSRASGAAGVRSP